MPIVNIDGITVIYGREKHIRAYLQIALQARLVLNNPPRMTIRNIGPPTFNYRITVDGVKYTATTRKIYTDDTSYENALDTITKD